MSLSIRPVDIGLSGLRCNNYAFRVNDEAVANYRSTDAIQEGVPLRKKVASHAPNDPRSGGGGEKPRGPRSRHGQVGKIARLPLRRCSNIYATRSNSGPTILHYA
jgi:hypothetical protein